ncbi:MAG: DUF4377 domain-containing protein [Bacteroidia bacterium]|nr:DUF4377 domain-containing protein [Bacteroidia bacterium]
MTKRILITVSIIGIIMSACNTAKKATEKTIYIGAETKPCQLGEMKAECMQVKWAKDQKDWENFGQTTDIEGFAFEKGYEYELVINETKIDNLPADTKGVKYKLVKQVTKTKLNNDEQDNAVIRIEKTIYIGAETKPCQLGEIQAECMQVKWTKDQKDWENFGQPTDLEGFVFEKGYEYELIISEEKLDKVPADASSLKYKLIKEVSKKKK